MDSIISNHSRLLNFSQDILEYSFLRQFDHFGSFLFVYSSIFSVNADDNEIHSIPKAFLQSQIPNIRRSLDLEKSICSAPPWANVTYIILNDWFTVMDVVAPINLLHKYTFVKSDQRD